MTTITTLTHAIANFRTVQARYRSLSEAGAPEADEQSAFAEYEHAEDLLIRYPCRSLTDIRDKSRAFLADQDGLGDTLRNCFSSEGHCLDLFLRSLLGVGDSIGSVSSEPLAALIKAHDEALAAYDAVTDEELKDGDDPSGKVVDSAIAAILDHRPATAAEAAEKAAFMAGRRTFREWDSLGQDRLLDALIVEPRQSTIATLYADWRTRWDADFGNSSNEEFERNGEEIRRLAKLIQAETPTTAQEFAMQLIVDIDDGYALLDIDFAVRARSIADDGAS